MRGVLTEIDRGKKPQRERNDESDAGCEIVPITRGESRTSALQREGSTAFL